MEQLTGLDSAFLALETRTTTGHVGGVIVLDPSTAAGPVTFAGIRALMAERLTLVPLLRRRLVRVPLGLDQPYWIEDRDFDLDFHIREVALPEPGDQAQLCELVGRLHSLPLDLDRPLWEMFVISGLSEGQLALYTKVHHAAIDGVSGAELLTVLLDLTPEPRPAPEDSWRGERHPFDVELLGRAALSASAQPIKAVKLAGSIVGAAPRLGEAAVPYAAKMLDTVMGKEHADGGIIGGLGLIPPVTPFNRSITAHRRVAFRSVSLQQVKDVKNAHGVTVNDVVMAMSTAALRRWLQVHDALPDAPLIAMVPVSVRSDDDRGTGNKVSAMFSTLPTNVDDPVERLMNAHESTSRAKRQHMALPQGLVEDVTEFMVPGLFNRAARVSMSVSLGLFSRSNPSNIVISNVPGPNIPVYMAGAQMLRYYPVAALADGLGLNISVVGYLNELHFGLVACRDTVPDIEAIADALVDELAVLVDTLPSVTAADPQSRPDVVDLRTSQGIDSEPTLP
ncbi:MAG: wax ester/triacylglycerol synthase family O-acyltransferase [Actinomycetes bacterium]